MSVGIITDCYGNIRWKWDYMGDAVPIKGRRLNNLNSMRNEDDYPTYSTNIVDCFIKETKYKPKPKECFASTLEDKFKELFMEGDKYMPMIESWKRLRATTEDCTISLSELKNRSHTVSWGNAVNKEDNDNMNKENSSCINERAFIVKIENNKKIKEIYTWLNECLAHPTAKVTRDGCFVFIKYYLAYCTDKQINGTNRFLESILHFSVGEEIKIVEIKADSIIALSVDHAMPDITDYTYDPDTATTTITWSDNTTTTVTAEDPVTADQYTGFMTAYAKKAAGNTSRIQSIYERALKLPEKKALAEQKAKEQEEEQRKIKENQKARKRRQRVRREARRRKEEYEKSLIREEAKRLAEKEYGVPYDKNDWLKTNEDKGHETT